MEELIKNLSLLRWLILNLGSNDINVSGGLSLGDSIENWSFVNKLELNISLLETVLNNNIRGDGATSIGWGIENLSLLTYLDLNIENK